jgi:hypothetical protein
MNKGLTKAALVDLEQLISQNERLRDPREGEHVSFIVEFALLAESAIHRWAGQNSVHYNLVKEIKNRNAEYPNIVTSQLFGVLSALKTDIENGYLSSIEELVNANTFSDFLEMAEHLLEENYKDPAAVIIGSVLEEHIRKLCAKAGISIDGLDSKGVLRSKKADLLNSELASANIYNKLDQKSVTSWLDLRNKAAHGQYAEYKKEQVDLLLQSVRDFITRHPA